MGVSATQGGAGRLRRVLDTLGVKLFLAIAGAHLVLVMAVYLVYSWSFDKGLVDYVNQAEQARLTPMIEQLADGYRQQGNWRWVADDREVWVTLLRQTLGWRMPRREREREGGRDRDRDRGARDAGLPSGYGPGSAAGQGRAPASVSGQGERAPLQSRELRGDAGGDRAGNTPPLTIDWRLMLLDASQTMLIPFPGGDAGDLERAVKLPIVVDGRTVGYLGYVPRLRLVQSLESITAAQQSRRFGVIALGMFVAVLLNAALISHWLTRRLRALGQGATALARGDYAVRIPAHGHDEIARLAGDFNHLAQALEAAQRGRQQWIADIAHELRTPLTSLRAEIEAVQDGVRPLTRASVDSVAQEVQRLTRLVEDLRLLSLSDLGALTYRKEPVAVATVIGDVLAAARGAIAERGLQVQTGLDASVVVDADADRLAQVFGNLLQNTLRYSEAPARLAIAVRGEGDRARIDWEDSPPGVDEADLPRLTERLFRVDASRSRASGGSGLGLAIVKAIVEGHGGQMTPGRSALGGLRWTLRLPRFTGKTSP